MKDSSEILQYVKLKWPVLVAIVISIFVVIFFSNHIFSAQRSQYENAVKEAMSSANYQEAVIRLTQVFNGGAMSSTGAQITGMSDISNKATLNGGRPVMYLYKRVITDEKGEEVKDSTDNQNDFDRIFDSASSSKAEDVTSTMTAGINAAIKGQKDVNFEVFDSLLVAALNTKGAYAPYTLELVYTDSTALNRSITSDKFHNSSLYKFTSDLALEQDSKVYYRLTTTPLMLLLDKLSGVITLSMLALLLIIACIIYLSRLLTAMKETEAMREEFTHLVTHNMNNPISIALASAETLQEMDAGKEDDRNRGQYIEVLLRQLRKLSEQVKSILRSCKADEMDKSFNPSEIKLCNFITSLTSQMNVAHPEASFSINIEPDVTIKADLPLFEEMMENLIQNAIKYSVKKPEITISYGCGQDGRTRLSIKDNGKGMPADALDNIFNRYYKVEHMSSTPGYGLGLHFVKQVIDKHGWNIHVESTEGEGSTFTIII